MRLLKQKKDSSEGRPAPTGRFAIQQKMQFFGTKAKIENSQAKFLLPQKILKIEFRVGDSTSFSSFSADISSRLIVRGKGAERFNSPTRCI